MSVRMNVTLNGELGGLDGLTERLTAAAAEGMRGVSNSGFSYPSSWETMVWPMYRSTLVARSLLSLTSNREGVSSMNLVWHLPPMKVGWERMLFRNDMLVLTPRMRISPMPRLALRMAPSKVRSKEVIFTSRES